MRKALSMLLAAFLFVAVFAMSACDGSLFLDTGEEIDTSKTQLYVSNYNGGVGSLWLDKVAERFEEEFADTEFTEGKYGVQIIVDNNKLLRTDLGDTLATTTNEVFFGERMFYSQWAEEGLLLDITDIVQEDLTEYGENRSIKDKLSSEKRAMLTSPNGTWNGGVFTSGGRYYALPHYEGFLGVTYNVDLFDWYGFYFNTEGNIIGDVGGTKSAGPDGVSRNDDDGLPASIEQFKKLCNYMTMQNVTPFVWTGMYSEYFTILLDALVTAQLGKEGSEVVYTFNEDLPDGEKTVSTVITGFSGGEPQLGTTVIDETTGYLLYQQAALYYALDFAYTLLNSADPNVALGQWYTDESVNGSYDHLMAQEDFVNGSYDSSNRIAMLIDGNYWENEAADAIARSESSYNYDYDTKSNFAWMPLPGTAVGDEGSAKLTLKDSMQSYAFIAANIPEEKIELAKMFLQYCFTDESLREFTVTTGMTRDYDYTLSSDEMAQLSSYAQSILAYRETADIVNTSSIYTVFQANEDDLVNSFWETQGTGVVQSRPYTAFWVDKVTAQQFFTGMGVLHTRTAWDTANRGYYDKHDVQSDEVINRIS